MRYEILKNDRCCGVNVEALSQDKIRVGVLFVECFTQSPIELEEYRFDLPREMVNQPVPRIATEMEFELL